MIARNDERLAHNIRRTVGIAALHRLRAMIDAQQEADLAQGKWLRYVLTGLLLLACFLVPCFLAYRLGVI
ncbi:MAG: hypothetical protein GC139_03950 [Sideroxydans sp.]|nr:hypothetical protein [Sideroxydans sp.]